MRNTILLKKVNGQPIQIIEKNGDKFVPIKPICEMLGIDAKAQREKINEHKILRSVGRFIPSTGADGKQYEMLCLPLKFIFGWLFSINPEKVREEIRPAVLKYQWECYYVLFEYFIERADFVNNRKEAIEKAVDKCNMIRSEFNTAKMRLKEAENEITKERKVTFEEWKRSNSQLQLNFE
ncbi:MAG: phage antirepressor N-terminal domain-containing protein [Bacteroidales bacterium]|jgi:hypothetical protein|nr:phage antirepressor N-terminal domain-containing protein [Bacteroidales bacterium]